MMNKTRPAFRALMILTYIFVVAATNAQAGPDLEFVDLDIIGTKLNTYDRYDYTQYEYRPTDAIRLTYTLKNVGDEKPSDVVVRLYLSTDSTISSDDAELTSSESTRPSPGKTQFDTFGWRFQKGDFPPGEYYVGVIVSCPGDTNPDNDVFCISTPISYNGSDLKIESLGFSGFSASGSGELSIDYCVENIGAMDADSAYVYFFASTDTTISQSDHALFETSVGSLGSGRASCRGRTVTLEGLDRGEYYVGAIVACGTDIDDLSNNVYCTGGMFSLPAGPDLSVRDVQAESGFFRSGDTIELQGVVTNTGYGSADRYTVDFYASTDGDIDSSDYLIGSQTGGSLDVGDEDTFSTSCQFPHDLPDDDYYLGVIVTCSDDIDSENNEGVVSSGSVWVGALADLALESVQVTKGVYAPDEKVVIYSLVKNIGGYHAYRYTVDYYVSTDTTITEDDYRIGSVDRGGLAAGEQDSYETTYRVPYSIPAGNYYMGVIVTLKDELNSVNNVGRSTEMIELIHPSGTVCGHIQYKYTSSPHQAYSDQTYPIRYALVQIFENDHNDSLDDRLVGQTHTDPNGNYKIILSPDEKRHDDLYVKVLTEGLSGAYPDTTSRLCILKDTIFHETYACVSDVHPHPGNASEVINITAPSLGEFMVFDSMVEGFIKAKTLFNVELKEISAYWPSETGGSYFDPCEVGIYIAQDDRRDRDVIMHEYGHYVAQTYGVGLGSEGESPIHYWDRDLRFEPVWRTEDHAMNLAFREAWASWFSIASQYGDTGWPNSGDSQYADIDEESHWTLIVDLDNDGETGFSPGQYFENMNAGVLWDIFDDKNDSVNGGDTVSDPSLSMIWAISRDFKPETILDFWNSWFQEYDHERDMTYIFESHKMWFNKPGQ